MPRSRLNRLPPIKSFTYETPRCDPKKTHASIPIIISIVIVPMMVPVPAVPPIFVRVTIVAVSVVTIVIGPDLLVTRAHVNSKSIICFGFSGCESERSERCQSQEEISFHMILFLVRRKRISSHAALRFRSASPLKISEVAGFHRPTGGHPQRRTLTLYHARQVGQHCCERSSGGAPVQGTCISGGVSIILRIA